MKEKSLELLTQKKILSVVEAVKRFQEKYMEDGDKKKMTNDCNSYARRINAKIGTLTNPKTGELKEQPKISERYYVRVMNEYRAAVKALGYKHHDIEKKLNSFINQYGSEKPDIIEMLDPSLPIEVLRENFIKIRPTLMKGSAIRSDFLNLKFEHHMFYTLAPKEAVKKAIGVSSGEALEKRINNQLKVNPELMIEKITSVLSDPQSALSDVYIALAVATGRRATEITKTASFDVTGESTLMFAGQLKTKNRHLFEIVAPYEIPTLIHAEIAYKALQRIRKETKDIELSYFDELGNDVTATIGKGDNTDYRHNQAVQKYFKSTLNNRIRSLFEDGGLTFKDARAIYAKMAYELFKLPGESESAFRHRVLGHVLLETQTHYDVVSLEPNLETIVETVDQEEEKTTGTGNGNSLLAYLSQFDAAMLAYVRAPKVNMIHRWLKEAVSGGLPLEMITATYVRRHCLIEGKQLNFDVVKGYLGEPKRNKQGEVVASPYKGPSINLSNFDPETTPPLPEKKEGEAVQPEAVQAPEEKTESWPSVESVNVVTKKQGDGWNAVIIANQRQFEVWSRGRKNEAINAVKDLYLRETKQVSK